ncbi:hypothetical protein ABVT39_016930 [Epinephelus coioides]
MDRKKKRPGGAEKQRTKKLKLTDLFGAVVTTPAAAGSAPGDERGGPGQTHQREPVVILSVTDDERVEADMSSVSIVSMRLATQLTLRIYGSGMWKQSLDLWKLHPKPAEALHWTVGCAWDVI